MSIQPKTLFKKSWKKIEKQPCLYFFGLLSILLLIIIAATMEIYSLQPIVNNGQSTFTKNKVNYTKIEKANIRSSEYGIKNNECLVTDYYNYSKLVDNEIPIDEDGTYLILSSKWNKIKNNSKNNININNITFKEINKNDYVQYNDQDFTNTLRINNKRAAKYIFFYVASFCLFVYLFKYLRFKIFSPSTYLHLVSISKLIVTIPTMFVVVPNILLSAFNNVKIFYLDYDYITSLSFQIFFSIYLLALLCISSDYITFKGDNDKTSSKN